MRDYRPQPCSEEDQQDNHHRKIAGSVAIAWTIHPEDVERFQHEVPQQEHLEFGISLQ